MPPRREDTYCRGGSLLGLLHSKRFHDLPHQGCFRIFPPDEEKVDHRVEVLNFKSTRGFDVQVFVEMRKAFSADGGSLFAQREGSAKSRVVVDDAIVQGAAMRAEQLAERLDPVGVLGLLHGDDWTALQFLRRDFRVQGQGIVLSHKHA